MLAIVHANFDLILKNFFTALRNSSFRELPDPFQSLHLLNPHQALTPHCIASPYALAQSRGQGEERWSPELLELLLASLGPAATLNVLTQFM